MIRLLDIQRMSSEDGPGLRTTAFLKGCTLTCAWCHNPESISSAGEVLWHKARCMGCEACAEVCPQQGIALGDQCLSIDRPRCLGCFTCVRACPTGAVEAKGREISVDELARELLKDRAYFGSDGGVTLSGGEALMQAEVIDLLRALHASGVSVAVDTCGQIKPERLEAALAYTDLVLYDLKLADSAQHERWTGVGNELILANLARVIKWAASGQNRQGGQNDQRGQNHHLWLRTPIIPGATDSDANITDLARIVAALPEADSVIERWELAAFNKLCASKYESIEREWTFADASLVTSERMRQLVARAQSACPGLDIRATGATTEG